MIEQIIPDDVIATTRQTLGLHGAGSGLDEVLLAGLLRHTAGILCPCSRAALRSALVESMAFLAPNTEELASNLDDLIEDLIVGGDLLELNEVAFDNPDVRGTWVFAAPPSFIERPSGAVFLTGIVPDQDRFLSSELASRVTHEGCTRFILPTADDNLAQTLLAEGLQHLSESVWLKAPRPCSADEHLQRYATQLEKQQRCGEVPGIEILDAELPARYYRGRWDKPKLRSGNFVGRRPQEFGSPLWCFVQLSQGVPQRLIDLPRSGYRWRGCDSAWHLQMAIDYCRGAPQAYRQTNTDTTALFQFYSPLPEWSRRRFMILGKRRAVKGCLLAYEIPLREAGDEARILQDELWMCEAEEIKGEG
ncbi:hypothetical protein [Qipengyuania mesophila]|uniref:hypothetical protein n=1 Tax=Qipengyuania mesophila TaxID=2867246 RepID=UPI00351616E5